MPTAEIPVLVFSDDRVLKANTINIKRDGVTIVATDTDLSFFKNDSDEVVVGAQMIVKFVPAKSNGLLTGAAFDVRLVNVLRMSVDRFRVFLAFQSLDRIELASLKQYMATLG